MTTSWVSPRYAVTLVHVSVSSSVVLTGSSPWGERLPAGPGWGRSGRAGADQGARGRGRDGGGGAGHIAPGTHLAGSRTDAVTTAWTEERGGRARREGGALERPGRREGTRPAPIGSVPARCG